MSAQSEEQVRGARPRSESSPSSVYSHPRLRLPSSISALTLIHPYPDPPPQYTTALAGDTPPTRGANTNRSSVRRSSSRDCPINPIRQGLSPRAAGARFPSPPSPRRPPCTLARPRSSPNTQGAAPQSLSYTLLHSAYAICPVSVGMSMGVTYPQQPPPYPCSSSEDDDSVTETEERQRNREAEAVWSSWVTPTSNGVRHRKSTPNLRVRGGGRMHDRDGYGIVKGITTVPGVRGAGETETEGDDTSHLPNTRIIPPSPSTSTPLEILYQIACWLSIVPAVLGTVWNFLHVVELIDFAAEGGPKRVDHGIAMLWAILTGHLHRMLTLGLLTRWRIYYSPLPTLIRLLALQAICWPATHFTLTFVGHIQRPMVCWAVVGTTTAVSRAVVMWVVSNLPGGAGSSGEDGRRGRRWDERLGVEGLGERRWDWQQVVLKCAFPVGVVYFIMAWAGVLKAELWGC